MGGMHNKTNTICSSAAFYKQVVELKNQLEQAGYVVFVPHVALEMEKTGDYEVEHYKTWFGNADDYYKKAELMHAHFDKVVSGDVTLVVNNEKRGVANYIGGNVLMEMALAFHLHKPIFLLNEIPEASAFEEEIKGMGAIPLHGNVLGITEELARIA